MGMYTCFTLSCKVKKEYRDYIKQINEGAEWKDFVDQMPFVKEYSKQSRADFIPHGALSAYNDDKFGPQNFNTYGSFGTWNFLCDMKNYDSTIEQFIQEVLPHLCERVYFCAYWYEEKAHPTIVNEKDILGEIENGEWWY